MQADLEQARLRATAAGTTGCWHQSDQPIINNVNYQCATLRRGAPNHASASQRLGLRRSALFLPLFPGCDGRCRSVESIGNVLAYYVTARAAATAGRLDFLLMMRDCPLANHVLQLLPKAVPAAAGGGAPSYEAAAALACDGYPDMLAHKTRAWWPAASRFRVELRTAMAAWASRSRFPPIGTPYDDVAVHFRCGDVFKRQNPEYGVLPLTAIAALVPEGVAVTVGAITLP